MTAARLRQGKKLVPILLLAALHLAALPRTAAQLAITEVMSSAATNFASSIVTTNSDYFELTNFGTNVINLRGYRQTDDDHPTDRNEFLTEGGTNDLFIRPFESILFVRNTVSSNEAQVRSWWGRCLAPNVQVAFYSDHGLSRFGDGLRIYDPQRVLVDRVQFLQARRGHSFTYNSTSGVFGTISLLGEGGACRAERSEDIGSPGRTTGPIPLRIVKQPQDVVSYETLNARFSVEAHGMPRPTRYQWFFNGLAIPGAVRDSLTISNAASTNEGQYHVQVWNGLETVTSAAATLSLNRSSTAPVIVSPPANSTVLPGSSARFSVTVAALPLARYQWFINGTPVQNGTNRSLLIRGATLEMSGSQICVRAANALGAASACARLFVTPKLDLRITEIQAHPNPGPGNEDHADWFELTNFSAEEIQLQNYRFNDDFSLETAFVIEEQVSIAAGESIIFVKDSSVGSFLEWWGPENLPADLKVIAFTGFSLRREGETLFLWTDLAQNVFEHLEAVSFEPTTGRTQWFDKELAPFGLTSELQHPGAFVAAQGGDIGSPGYVYKVRPRVLGLIRDRTGVRLRVRTVPGTNYELQFTSALGAAWESLATRLAVGSELEFVDSAALQSLRGFYRVVQKVHQK